ncbi:MAG: Uma2 family endonuclease [Spirulina sp. SIO3F2]|nr:Uma2 family endonuclease [Spirulina sp. SIO3F2]
MIATAPRPSLSFPPEILWRLTVTQYHQMIAAGIFTDDDRVELLDGVLTLKMPKKPAHRIATKLLRKALEALMPEGWYVDTQEPITLDTSEPEPDVVVVRGDTRDYRDRHPGPRELGLVVEVADATLERDRTLKQRLYAQSGIACYWVVNLPERQLEVYTQPKRGEFDTGYQQVTILTAEDSIQCTIEGTAWGNIPIQDILP